jgi:hypothetical protein
MLLFCEMATSQFDNIKSARNNLIEEMINVYEKIKFAEYETLYYLSLLDYYKLMSGCLKYYNILYYAMMNEMPKISVVDVRYEKQESEEENSKMGDVV